MVVWKSTAGGLVQREVCKPGEGQMYTQVSRAGQNVNQYC